jgi:hypothetical protein
VKHHDQIKKIAYVSLNDQENGFILKRQVRRNESQQEDLLNEGLKVVVVEKYLEKYMNNIDYIKLVVRKTKLRKNAVIKKISVFGKVFHCKTHLDLINSINDHVPNTLPTTSTKRTDTINNIEEGAPNFQIPDDFLDSITFQIMNLPYILPCGSAVDESTLTRHKRIEENYGRVPSDPFTGKIFTKDSYPKFSASLKMRLDEFKNKHNHEIEVMKSGRSIGRKNVLHQNSSCTQKEHMSKKIKIDASNSLDSIIKSIYERNQISIFTKGNKLLPSSSSSSTSTITSAAAAAAVETVAKNIACVKCKESNSLLLYNIRNCQHIYCKKCLREITFICEACGQNFENKDIEKINY